MYSAYSKSLKVSNVKVSVDLIWFDGSIVAEHLNTQLKYTLLQFLPKHLLICIISLFFTEYMPDYHNSIVIAWKQIC